VNGRVADKVMIALPLELSLDEQNALVRDFAERASQGRVPFLAGLHCGPRDADNPHAHIVFFDRDPDSGRRVMKTTDPGSTERLRVLWQDVANEHLQKASQAVRIDRRSLAAQGLSRPVPIHVGPKAMAVVEKGLSLPVSKLVEKRNKIVDYPTLDQGRSRHEAAQLRSRDDNLSPPLAAREAGYNRALSIRLKLRAILPPEDEEGEPTDKISRRWKRQINQVWERRKQQKITLIDRLAVAHFTAHVAGLIQVVRNRLDTLAERLDAQYARLKAQLEAEHQRQAIARLTAEAEQQYAARMAERKKRVLAAQKHAAAMREAERQRIIEMADLAKAVMALDPENAARVAAQEEARRKAQQRFLPAHLRPVPVAPPKPAVAAVRPAIRTPAESVPGGSAASRPSASGASPAAAVAPPLTVPAGPLTHDKLTRPWFEAVKAGTPEVQPYLALWLQLVQNGQWVPKAADVHRMIDWTRRHGRPAAEAEALGRIRDNCRRSEEREVVPALQSAMANNDVAEANKRALAIVQLADMGSTVFTSAVLLEMHAIVKGCGLLDAAAILHRAAQASPSAIATKSTNQQEKKEEAVRTWTKPPPRGPTR
jgi:hypothetical protein